MLINNFIGNPWYWKMYIEYIFARSASLPDGDGLKTDAHYYEK